MALAQNEMKAKDGLPVPVRLTEGLGRSRGFEGREPKNAFSLDVRIQGCMLWRLRRFCAAREPDCSPARSACVLGVNDP